MLVFKFFKTLLIFYLLKSSITKKALLKFLTRDLSISLSVLFLLYTLWSSVQFSRSVVSNSLWPHEPQHARPPYPSPTPSQPKPMSIELLMPSSHLILCFPFSSCHQSLQASESFPMSQLFASGGQGTWVSASTSVLPMNTQDWSP